MVTAAGTAACRRALGGGWEAGVPSASRFYNTQDVFFFFAANQS